MDRKTNQIGVRLPADVIDALRKYTGDEALRLGSVSGIERVYSAAEACRDLVVDGLRSRGYLAVAPLEVRIARDLRAALGQEEIAERNGCSIETVTEIRDRLTKMGEMLPRPKRR